MLQSLLWHLCITGTERKRRQPVSYRIRTVSYTHLDVYKRQDQKKGVVRGICISKKRGTAKYPVESARIVPDWGIEEDAHGGKWHRQISLLALEKIEAFREQGADVDFGAFGENLIIEGFDLRNVPVDSEIRIGDTVRLKVTQIGKECHSHCAIYRRMGDCIMPREGIFAEVLEGGNTVSYTHLDVYKRQALYRAHSYYI